MKIIHITSFSYLRINGIISVLQALVPEQEQLNNDVAVLNLCSNKNKLFNNEYHIKSAHEFKILIKEFQPDIVVFHGNYNLKYYRFAWFLLHEKIPYLIVPHGGTSRQNFQKNKTIKILVNFLMTSRFIKKSHGLIFLNKQEHESSIYFGKCKYFIIPNGVNCLPIRSIKKPQDKIVHFFYLSRIDFLHKGLDILLDGIELFTLKNPSFKCDFTFYGGSYDSAIITKFNELIDNMKTHIEYYGEVVGEDKERAFMRGNIYMLTSRYEGMPLSVLEALSYGNACIVTPQTNMAELVKDNKVGWVTQTKKEDVALTLEEAYRAFIIDRKGYVVRATTAIKPYNWSEIAKRSIMLYDKVRNNY